MKKITLLLTIALCCNALPGFSQWITGMHIVPPNPVAGDAISVVAEASFPSGTCNQKTTNFQVIGNDILASALHCIGPLTYICGDTDSFYVGLLPPGNYRFIYQVDAGMAPSPCTPGIVAGPTDTLSFIVGAVTGIVSNDAEQDFVYTVKGNSLSIKTTVQSYTAYIYNSSGQKVYAASLTGNAELDLHHPARGIYTILTFNDKQWNHHRFMIY